MVEAIDTRFKEFSERVEDHRQKLRMTLMGLKVMNKRIVGVSAPAKGNTLLNYCKIGRETLDYIGEIRGSRKVGCFTPGTHIPVVEEAKLIEDQPGYALILAWNWAEPIKDSLRKQGYKGKFIIPLPNIEITNE